MANAQAAWANLHRQFLARNNPKMLQALQKEGKLQSYLDELGSSAEEMHQQIVSQMSSSSDLPDNPEERAKRLAAIPRVADELVMSNLVNQPLPQR